MNNSHIVETNRKSDLDKIMQTVGAEGFMLAVDKHITFHFVCLLRGHAILLDEDGMWCSDCEREQFDIGVEEQNCS